jgi:hypothetical protein
MRFVTWLCAVALTLGLWGLPVQAAKELPDLSGPVMLTVTGLDPDKFPDGQIEFDLGRLKALGGTEFSTATIWTNGVHDYAGLAFKDLVDFLGLTAGSVKALALNDYSVEIPISDAVSGGPMLAYAVDGRPMPLRDKGPIWFLYPFDQNPDYQSEVTFTRAIWQLDRIEVEH